MTTQQWLPNEKIDGLDASCGLDRWEGYMPPMEEIPQEFKRGNQYTGFAQHWFFRGIEEGVFGSPAEGINGRQAMRHLAALLRSFSPSQEHKISGVGYLLSLWFPEAKL